jgi:SAM-dependent methyltransferase
MLIHANWVEAQTNSVLQGSSEVAYAVRALNNASLHLHPDHNKNWDNLLAISHTLVWADEHDAVLDAGAGDESAYLPGLRDLGYDNLIGCNLDRHDDYKAGLKNGILYAYADITATPYPRDCFAFVSCLSVIEHGVDWRAFLCEMRRILVPNGGLFVSFDYWPTKLQTTGRITHGAPINIFSAIEVAALLDFAESVGLEIVGKAWDPKATDSVVSWAGLNYTFGNLLLRKVP